MIEKKTIDRKSIDERHRHLKVENIKHKKEREICTKGIWANTSKNLKLTELLKSSSGHKK